ncbi:GNAT family N-acetyltransferase [Neobacillus sp. PS3-40]|uniref:GNAT family N-acetyltransferase n=1 Tax=Neobacillus sp. PS3-40 TaxID=3070679 RepID=UPI0027DFB60A|nr:GNAT family N-acetyltransferase [Neobacillus sp. PS3-40]WML46378.1 GNAT family N-acetyltransferase [Neobacillus sp. PS3-40]
MKKLSKQDHEDVMAFLSEEPSINLFIIGDIEGFGYDTDFQELWAEYDDQEEIKAILLRFYQSFIVYAKGDFDVQGFATIMLNHSKTVVLSGKADIVEKFENIEGLTLGKKQLTYFAECRSSDLLGTTSIEMKQATLNDVDQIINLRKTISEFHVQEDAAEILRKSMETKTGRTYYTENKGLMTSCASTTAENSLSAMIVGVCTRNENRCQGLATAIMQRLCKEILDEGKVLCLFYSNPEAGKIYKRLGFKDIGMWTMYR